MKRKCRALMLLLIILAPASPGLFAQVYARIEGTVKNSKGKAIEGAQVILIFAEDKSKVELTTDKKGRWGTRNLRAGAWTIGFTADGHTPQNLNVSLTALKENTPPIHIRLGRVPKSPLSKGNALYKAKKFEAALKERI